MNAAAGPPSERILGEEERKVAAQALLSLLRGPVASVKPPDLTPVLWDGVLAEAARHQVVPILFRRLERPDVRATVPADVYDSLRDMFVLRAFRTTKLMRETAAAIRMLEAAGIRTMVLKGVHLAAAVYPEPAFRGMADVDFMVDRDQLAAAEALFVDQGWGPLPRPDVDRFCEQSNHLAKLWKPGSIVIEIHYHIERPTSPFRIPVSELWANARPVELEGVRTLGLAPEELILHLCIHASYHHRYSRAPLKALLDVRAVAERYGDAIDWPRLRRIATEWGVGRFVYSTLRLANAVLAAPIDERDIAMFERDQADDELVDVAKDYIVTPFVDLPEAYELLAEPVRFRNRLRLLTRSVFLPPVQMRVRYGVKAGSPAVFLYYLLRPFDLLYRRGGLLLGLLLRTRKLQPTLKRERDRRLINHWVDAAHDDPTRLAS